jgi:hypothetical protein
VKTKLTVIFSEFGSYNPVCSFETENLMAPFLSLPEATAPMVLLKHGEAPIKFWCASSSRRGESTVRDGRDRLMMAAPK